jgi:transcriptional regulator with XRE-family HTH domain
MRTYIPYHRNDWKNETLLYEEIGRRVKEFRLNKGMTQQKLSDQIHLARSSIANLENGAHKISLHVLYEICSALEITIHQLLPANIEESS